VFAIYYGFSDAFKDSLLHPKNRKFAAESLRNVRKSCCVSGHISLSFEPKEVLETTTMLQYFGCNVAEKLDRVQRMMRRFDSTERCDVIGCGKSVRFPFIASCGDVLCEVRVVVCAVCVAGLV
jgi:hypothetical protein